MAVTEIDAILARPEAEVVDRLLSVAENQWYERKSARVAPKDLAAPLVAMANAEGGWIVVGLNNGTAEDVSDDQVNAVRQASIDFTQPPVHARVHELAVRVGDRRVRLVAIQVDPGDRVHETKSGDCYLRIGDESRKLGFAQRQELEYDRGAAPYDGTQVSAILADVATPAATAYQERIGSRTIEDMLAARGLVTPNGQLTVAAFLLFAERPQQLFPHAHVRVLRYAEPERGSGSNLTLEDDADIRCEGPLLEQVDRASAAIARLMPKRRLLGSDGRFTGVPIIPEDAWLEGLVNAVVHRSYAAAGDHVRVEIFPDRVEFSSPGRFPGLADPSRPLDIRRYARNPRIARVMADLGITQELGEGIRRMFDEMRRRGLTDPVYTQSGNGVRLVLSAADAIPDDVRAHLGRGAVALLDAMRLAGRPLGTGQAAALVGISRPTVLRQLKALRAAGLVEWDGQSERDPRAVWKLL